jgi:hypothetical protein
VFYFPTVEAEFLYRQAYNIYSLTNLRAQVLQHSPRTYARFSTFTSALESVFLSVQGPQSRFSILITNYTRLIYVTSVIRNKTRETPAHKPKQFLLTSLQKGMEHPMYQALSQGLKTLTQNEDSLGLRSSWPHEEDRPPVTQLSLGEERSQETNSRVRQWLC